MCKVSIIVPTFNRATVLKKTIDSILSQTFTDYELIIISNGSTDNTSEIVDAYKNSKIKFFYQQGSGSPASPRNQGIRIAKGEYIAFCDDDDLWKKTKLEQQVKLLSDHQNYGVCFTKTIRFSSTKQWKIAEFESVDSKSLLLHNSVTFSSVIIRKSILDQIECFDELPAISGAEDYELLLRLSKLTSFICMPKHLTLYYSGSERFSNKTANNSYKRNIKYFVRLVIVYTIVIKKGFFQWREILYPLLINFIKVSKYMLYDFMEPFIKRT